MLSLKSLDASHFVVTHDALTLFSQFLSLTIEFVDPFYLLSERFILFRCQPIADEVRLEIDFF